MYIDATQRYLHVLVCFHLTVTRNGNIIRARVTTTERSRVICTPEEVRRPVFQIPRGAGTPGEGLIPTLRRHAKVKTFCASDLFAGWVSKSDLRGTGDLGCPSHIFSAFITGFVWGTKGFSPKMSGKICTRIFNCFALPCVHSFVLLPVEVGSLLLLSRISCCCLCPKLHKYMQSCTGI